MGIDSRRVKAWDGNTRFEHQFPPRYNRSVLTENFTPYPNVAEYKGSNGCHYHSLPLTNHGIQGKRRITHSPGTTPTSPITTIAQLRLTSRNNTIALCINTERRTCEQN
jgi:hypothetical protein